MATKKKMRSTPMQGRVLTAVLSLGLLAAAGMAGMYTVGRNEEQQQEAERLAEKIAEAERAFENEQAEAEPDEQEVEQEIEQEEEQRQPAASSSAKANFQTEPELESEFAYVDGTAEEQAVLEEEILEEETLDPEEMAEASFTFSPEEETLLWPVAGNVILDYSMDRTVYFETLEQYKYNPAVIIQGEVGQDVLCGADGIVESIVNDDVTGLTVTMDFGNGYEGVYGQLKDLTVEEGRQVAAGEKLGCVSSPTRYFAREGANVYFKVQKDGAPVDPMDMLQ